MSATAIRWGRVFVELAADDSALQRTLRQAERKLRDFGNQMRDVGKRLMLVGTAGLGALGTAAATFSQVGDNIAKMAKRIGISGQALQELIYITELGGASTEVLESGLKKMAAVLDDARRGSISVQETLARLGLSAQRLSKLNMAEQFVQIGLALNNVADKSERAALAQDLFGRSGLMLLPIFEGGAEALDQMRQRWQELGLALSDTELALAEETNDRFSELKTSLINLASVIGAALAPLLIRMVNALAHIIGAVMDWIRAHQGLVLVVGGSFAVITALGATLIGLGLAAKITGIALASLAAMISTAASIALAVLTSKVVILAAGFVAWAHLLFDLRSVLAGLFNGLRDAFGRLLTMWGDGLEAMGAALASGQVADAAKVLWGLLQITWEEGTAALLVSWDNLLEAIIRQWHRAVDFIADGLVGLLQIFADVLAAVGLVQQDAVDQYFGQWKGTMDQARKERDQARQEELKKAKEEREKKLKMLRDEVAKTITLVKEKAAADKERLRFAGGGGGMDVDEFGLRGSRQQRSEGTFLAAGLRGLTGVGFMARVARNTDRLVILNQKMERRLQRLGKFD